MLREKGFVVSHPLGGYGCINPTDDEIALIFDDPDGVDKLSAVVEGVSFEAFREWLEWSRNGCPCRVIAKTTGLQCQGGAPWVSVHDFKAGISDRCATHREHLGIGE
jgi:hypothetical protein